MNIRVVVEYDPETESYAAYCPELPGCASCGETEEEALGNMKEAILLYLEPSTGEVSANAKVVEVSV